MMRALEKEIERLQCGLLCEKEQNKSLSVEHANIKGQLQKAREQNMKLQEELDRTVEDSLAKVKILKPALLFDDDE